MKHPRQNWNGDFLRVDFSTDDVETLEALLERLDALLKIEEALGVVGVVSPFISTPDIPTVTAEARELIKSAIQPWLPVEGEDLVVAYDETPND